MAVYTRERKSLLSSQARVQSPWVKVTIGDYTFGVFSRDIKKRAAADGNFYTAYNVQYPNYVQDLTVTKVNGQVNQYTLIIKYPIRPQDDPNFFEKVFSSVSSSRKIVFSYGDAMQPAYIYKNEEALITKVTQQFDLQNSAITYKIMAVSTAIKGRVGNFTFVNSGLKIPSEEIKKVFLNPAYGLQGIFTGMNKENLTELIACDDKAVNIQTKVNISPIDYISYLVSCMVPAGSNLNSTSKDIYILTIHDETNNDFYSDDKNYGGPYFKVTRTSYISEQTDAYEIDVGYNTSTIVTNFSINNDENYSIYYEYAEKLYPEEYTRRLNNQGKWEDVYAPTVISGNDRFTPTTKDIVWYTKLTKYPIGAQITIQGLLRPATLMQYVRLNVIFPGGHKHIASGLYIVTKQTDMISEQGYRTTLALTKISGDDSEKYKLENIQSSK